MSDTVLSFYNTLAEHYHLIFDDWDSSIARQARILNPLLTAALPTAAAPFEILDCACGIGTQALGLAALGHHVTASDLSPAAIARARREADARSLSIDFHVADMTNLADIPNRSFHVVAALDNALPHLDPDQLRATVRSMASRLRPGGLLLASIRDYDQILLDRPTMQPPAFFGEGPTRRIVHQVWDWQPSSRTDSTRYTLHLNITTRTPGLADTWQTHAFHSEYRCVTREELTAALTDAGLSNVRWLMPRDSGFYQPLVLAQR